MPMNYSTVSLVVESCNPRKGNPAMICTKTRSNNKPGVMSEIFPSLFRHFALGFLSLSPLSTKLASCYSRLAGSGAQIQRGSNKLYRVCLFHKCLRLCGFLAENGEGPRRNGGGERDMCGIFPSHNCTRRILTLFPLFLSKITFPKFSREKKETPQFGKPSSRLISDLVASMIHS